MVRVWWSHMCDGTEVADLHADEFPPLFLNPSWHTFWIIQQPHAILIIVTHLQSDISVEVANALWIKDLLWCCWQISTSTELHTRAQIFAIKWLFLLSSRVFSKRHSWAWAFRENDRNRKRDERLSDLSGFSQVIKVAFVWWTLFTSMRLILIESAWPLMSEL